MKLILQDKNTYVLSAGVGEEVIGQLQNFCKEQKIEAGAFFAIGACRELLLGWYDTDAKEYIWKELNEKLEIISLLGNIAQKDKEIVAHAHGSFSDRHMRMSGGHVAKLVVGSSCEIVLEKLEGRVEKTYDKQTGLSLMRQL